MSVSVSVNGTSYTIPQTGETGWGAQVTAWIQAVSSATLQKNGGTFTLTADADFGASFGLKSAYYKSRSAAISTAGILRLASTESVAWRNSGDSANLLLLPKAAANGVLTYGGIDLVDVSTAQTLTNKTLTSPVITGLDFTSLILTQQGSTPATPAAGKTTLYSDTSDLIKHVDDAGTVRTLVDLATSQTLTNKTLTSPVLTAPTVDAASMTDQSSAPASPSSGTHKFYVKTDGNAYLLDSSGTERLIGSGGTGINYITNGDFEAASTGWTTYADAAATTPVDGTGGSPNVTFARTTSSALRGAGSGLFTKDAANRQGQGVSYDFTIASADKGRVMAISAEYAIASGTFATGDMRVYIYDVTNSRLIEPAPTQIQSTTVNAVIRSEFQSSIDSTSYRLIFHVASTSTSAYTLKLDTVSVGPQSYANGVAVTDWQSYTLTIGAVTTAPTIGTTSKNAALWRRVGDSMEIRYDFEQSGAGSAGSGIYLFPIPTGYTIDTTKINSNFDRTQGACGIASFRGVANNWAGQAFVYNSTNLYLWGVNETSQIDASSANTPISTVDTRFSFQALVPISGWSSNSVVSSDADTRVVSLKATGNAASASAGNPIIFPTASWDTHAGYNASTGRYTVPVAGYYRVYGYIDSANTGTAVTAYVNAASVVNLGATDPNGECAYVGTVQVNAGDIIDIRPSGTLDANASSTMFIDRITGPAQIAASESVNARYYSSTTTISGSDATVVYATKDFDSHNAYSAGTYTVPVSGKYQVNAALRISATYALNKLAAISICVNGTAVSAVSTTAAAATTGEAVVISDIINCVAGSLITIKASSDATSPSIASSNTQNYVSIARVGN